MRSEPLTVPDLAAPQPRAQAAVAGPIVRLVQFPLVWGRNVSPFSLKLETWLRLAGVPFEVRSSINLAKAPKRKLPFIVEGGREIGDSTLIIEHLKTSRGIDPDSGLDARDRAETLALQRLFEDHLYFIMVYSRWLDPAGWPAVSAAFFEPLPWVVRPLGRRIARRRVRGMLHAQGIGRHSHDEIYEFGRRDLDAIATFLGERPFFAGDQLTTIDAVAYGFLANILYVPVETELKRACEDYPNLVGWCETMEAGLYAD
jgi:glutathione S-transferase